jgi:hypothetical protein
MFLLEECLQSEIVRQSLRRFMALASSLSGEKPSQPVRTLSTASVKQLWGLKLTGRMRGPGKIRIQTGLHLR